jgi:hypothetical protein
VHDERAAFAKEKNLYNPRWHIKTSACAQKISGLHYALHTHHFIYSQHISSPSIYIFQQNIKHLRSDIADIEHILAAQIPKRLRFSVRAQKEWERFSLLSIAAAGDIVPKQIKMRSRSYSTHLLFHIILKCRRRRARQYLPALKFFSNISNRLLRRRKHIKIYIGPSHRAKLRHICALGIRRAVCLDSFSAPSHQLRSGRGCTQVVFSQRDSWHFRRRAVYAPAACTLSPLSLSLLFPAFTILV